MINWETYPNFSKWEFDCKETGENAMQPHFLERLQALRTEYGKPMLIKSGFRSTRHSIEARKPSPGRHSEGIACDIGCNPVAAYEIVALAIKHGFTGIGISQRNGIARFVHLDLRDAPPLIWGY